LGTPIILYGTIENMFRKHTIIFIIRIYTLVIFYSYILMIITFFSFGQSKENFGGEHIYIGFRNWVEMNKNQQKKPKHQSETKPQNQRCKVGVPWTTIRTCCGVD